MSLGANMKPSSDIARLIEIMGKKGVVARGYDQLVDRYLERFGRSTVRARKLEELVADLPAGASALDLGCGAGVPVAHELSKRGFAITGVDGSARQIERAKCSVAKARFIHADMMAVEFPPASFDAVSAFYSITHVPTEEHAASFKRIAAWLRPGGRVLASFGTTKGDWSGDWLGTPMFFSHHDPEVTQRLVLDAGFHLERIEVLEQDNEKAEFLWISARKS
jgi:cyclopropane fatty-acyl-phospholipid synthase-like methyltransferase